MSVFTLLTFSIYFFRVWVLLPNQKKMLLLSCSKRNAQTAKLFKKHQILLIVYQNIYLLSVPNYVRPYKSLRLGVFV